MAPHVVLHNAASVDGRIDGFPPDLDEFYGLAATWDVDVHLAGSDTLLASGDVDAGDQLAEVGPADAPASPTDADGTPTERPDDAPTGDRSAPLLVVPDSRGRVGDWDAFRDTSYWRGLLVLCSAATPPEYLDRLDAEGIEHRTVGDDHVDLRSALSVLAADYDAETVLVDSGGTLSGVLLRASLVNEVSVLVHPYLVGGTDARSFVRGPDREGGGAVELELAAVDRRDGLVWLRYDVISGG